MRGFCLFLILLLTAVVQAQPTLSVSGNAHQGSAVFVRLSGLEGSDPPSVLWEDATYVMVRGSNNDWESVLAVSIDGHGSKALVVSAGEEQWTRTLEVKNKHYGHQSISLNPATLASYDDPQNKADDEAILEELEKDRTPRLFRSNFRYPVKAPQTTGFGLQRTYNGWRKGWHKGLDLAGWEGEAVRSPSKAVVIHTARGVVNGNTVVLSHGAGVGSVYLHLNSIQVTEGQSLSEGQVIGTVGGSGGFSPHLHWETRVHGVPVDPKLFFQLPKSWRE